MPADNISGSRELSAKPACDTSMFTILADMYTLILRVIMIIATLFVLHKKILHVLLVSVRVLPRHFSFLPPSEYVHSFGE